MEKAIRKTLIYSDIFEYPLTIFEIHKWLMGRKCNLRQVERVLRKLSQESRVKSLGEYYFLSDRKNIVIKRKRREKQSKKYFKKAQLVSHLLKIIPWIKLVGVSGGLAMENAEKEDDIDLIVVTSKNRLWLSRILTIFILDLLGVRRKNKMKDTQIAGKLCLNILLEEDCLEQKNNDIYTAHEVLQMRPLWERDGIYKKYLEDNEWAFKFLPNWIGSLSSMSFPRKRESVNKETHGSRIKYGMTDYIEALAKWFQLKIMQKPLGQERIQEGALYFHPNDIRPEILKTFKQKLSVLDK